MLTQDGRAAETSQRAPGRCDALFHGPSGSLPFEPADLALAEQMSQRLKLSLGLLDLALPTVGIRVEGFPRKARGKLRRIKAVQDRLHHERLQRGGQDVCAAAT